MIKHDELTPGKFYEVIFRGVRTNDSYLVVATSNDMVKTRWNNGRRYDTTGNITSSIQVTEISEAHFLEGQKPVTNNKEAAYLLTQDY